MLVSQYINTEAFVDVESSLARCPKCPNSDPADGLFDGGQQREHVRMLGPKESALHRKFSPKFSGLTGVRACPIQNGDRSARRRTTRHHAAYLSGLLHRAGQNVATEQGNSVNTS